MLPGVRAQEEEIPSSKIGAAADASSVKGFSIRVSVEEVRIDAVILDGKGRQITDLTADDFELYQDDQPQKINAISYVTDPSSPAAKPILPSKPLKGVPAIPSPKLTRDRVQRVIIFVVDDISMQFENVHYARMALRKFVEDQMQPGDIVSIVRSSHGISALQMFTSDKRLLLKLIETIRWGDNVRFNQSDNDIWSIYDGQLSTISYSVRALRDMPGRKAVLLITAKPGLPSNLFVNLREADTTDYQSMYVNAYNLVADAALRVGAVIHILDIRGLQGPWGNNWWGSSTTGLTVMPVGSAAEPENPVARKTGGLTLRDSNFFVNGIGRVQDALKGYYLVSYTPPETTFKENRRRIYHRVKIKVKRRGAEVRTRDGFYGMPEAPDTTAIAHNPLRQAILSPFQSTDLKVNLASGYMDNPQTGYLIRSWVHLDAENLTIVEDKDQNGFIKIETACVTSDINGNIHDATGVKYEFRVRKENIQWVKEHGIGFVQLLPVKKPGAYHARVAVRDIESGKVGSAYQYIDIPDLKKGRLALSDLFVINRKEDGSWIRAGIPRDNLKALLSPILSKDELRSPALRDYDPGDSFEYIAAVYNARSDKNETPDLESQYILYRNGLEIHRSDPVPLELNGMNDFARLPVRKRLLLGDAIQDGDYVIQLLVKDRKAAKKAITGQSLSFQIMREQE
jgi:VWFA-related protein